jgi:hypothetical protein
VSCSVSAKGPPARAAFFILYVRRFWAKQHPIFAVT